MPRCRRSPAERASRPAERSGGAAREEGLLRLCSHAVSDAEGLFGERFEVIRCVGEGGMGVVYEAHDRERDERVALKTLRSVNAAAIYRFKNEFRALDDVTHPNLVSLHELFADRERLFFTMELVSGVDFLRHVEFGAAAAFAPTVVSQRGSLEEAPGAQAGGATHPDRSLDVARLRAATRQLAEGVLALHRAGRLHRDIKPSNVLATPEGRVVLLDFGLITELGDDDDTRERQILGTPAYMAPEQAAGAELSRASDWYSVGVMLHEALAGSLPFEGTAAEILLTKQIAEAPPLPDAASRLAPDLAVLSAGLLRRLPGERPSGDAILRALSEGAVLPPPVPGGPGASGSRSRGARPGSRSCARRSRSSGAAAPSASTCAAARGWGSPSWCAASSRRSTAPRSPSSAAGATSRRPSRSRRSTA